MHYLTNEALIEKQKEFIREFSEREDNISRDKIIFEEVQVVALQLIEPLHSFHSVKARVLELVNLMEQGVFLPPILVEKRNNILMDGSHRYLASEYKEYSHIPVLYYRIID